MGSQWYVLCCKPNKDHILLEQLRALGYETFYPQYFVNNEKLGRSQAKPYFPGYAFIKIDLDLVGISTLQWMPNTEGLVCFGTKPAYVPDAMVIAIQRHIEALNSGTEEGSRRAELRNLETKGSPGRFKDCERLLDPKLSDSERVVGLLQILQGMRIHPTSGI